MIALNIYGIPNSKISTLSWLLWKTMRITMLKCPYYFVNNLILCTIKTKKFLYVSQRTFIKSYIKTQLRL